MIISMDLLLQSIGISGIFVFYIVLAKLSARMGTGLSLAPYYKWDYIACFFTAASILVHIYIHQEYEQPHASEFDFVFLWLYFLLLLIGNIIVITVSFRYWWWLKSELFTKRGDISE